MQIRSVKAGLSVLVTKGLGELCHLEQGLRKFSPKSYSSAHWLAKYGKLFFLKIN